MTFSLTEINNIIGFENYKSQSEEDLIFKKISIDSRSILPQDLFIAIEGNNFDGHDFISDVIKKGVKAAILNKEKEKIAPENFTYWVVADTREAFQKLALYWRKKLNIPVVAITGSVGKTTTKEITGEIMKNMGKIKISSKNNNNEIGVAKTILDSTYEDKLLILEMGMRGIGQIENLSKFSEPDIAVITNIGTSHIGLLGSKINIARAKCEIVKYLNPKGVVIIPSDDFLLEKTLNNLWKGRILKINIFKNKENEGNDCDKKNLLLGIYDELRDLIIIDNKVFQISYKGIHNVFNFLFAYAISQEFGIKFNSYNSFNIKNLEGRNRIIKKDKAIILDETYNASPESVKACIAFLLKFPGNHFLVLGSMKELGEMSTQYHLEILNLINEVDIECCVFICDLNEEESIKEKFSSQKVIFKNDKSDIAKIINSRINKNDYLLIKGSRHWKLEEIIPYII